MTTIPIPPIGFIEAAAMLGITTSSDDFPRLVAALNRAYSRGLQEGAALEREACAQACDALDDEGAAGDWPTPGACARAIRARGAA